MRGVETIRAAAIGLGLWCGLPLGACGGESDAVDAGHGEGSADASGERDAGPSGVGKIVIGEICPFPDEPGPVPPRRGVRGGIEFWSLQPSCLTVTHQPELDAVQVEHLQAAVSAFNEVSCSQLCVAPPRAEAFDPAALDADLPQALDSLDRRVHFMVDRRALPNGGLTELSSDPESGAVLGAFVFLPDAPEDPLERGDFLQLLGATLGLGAAGAGVDSVMSPDRPQRRQALTEVDETTLCELYGAHPLCE